MIVDVHVDLLVHVHVLVLAQLLEAAGKTSVADRSRYYATARGSAMECAAIIDVCRALGILDESQATRGKMLLVRIVAMLTKLCR